MLDRQFPLGDLAIKVGAQVKGDADVLVHGLATIQ